MLYFYLLDEQFFRMQMSPALGTSWRRRSFDPCLELCRELLPAAASFRDRYHIADEPLLEQVVRGLAFERHCWRLLAGEIMLFAAAAIPEIQTAPESLCALLAPERFLQSRTDRARFIAVEQVHYGSQDLVFGPAYYRPEHAGWNNRADVARLAEYLDSIDPEQWQASALSGLPDLATDEELDEELAFLRDWFPPLRQVYRQAHADGHVIVCENI